MDTFTIEVLATTDDPLDTLEAHDTLANDPTFTPRVIPTFRPDAYTKFWHPTFPELATRLIDEAGDGHTGYDGYLNAIAARRHYFREHGAVSSDHGTHTPQPCDSTATKQPDSSPKASTAPPPATKPTHSKHTCSTNKHSCPSTTNSS